MRQAIIAVTMTFMASGAMADIPSESIQAYNEALNAGDASKLETAALELTEAAMANPQDEQSTLLAFEGAWSLCRIGQCQAAIKPAEFALAQPPTSDHPVMQDRELLAAFAGWTDDKTRRTRKRLDAALAASVDKAPSLVSLTAFQQRYFEDVRKSDWGRVEDSAGETARHLEPVREQVTEAWISARFYAIVAAFSRRRNKDQHEAMVHLEGELYQMYYGHEGGKEAAPDWLKSIYWRASAWRAAMSAYFASTEGGRPGSRIGGRSGLSDEDVDELLAGYMETTDLTRGAADASDEDDGPPLCEGELIKEPELSYPGSAAFRGQVGAVIASYKFAEGRVTDVEVLASVPYGGFEDEVVETISQWRWEAAEAQPVNPCSMSYDNIVQTFVFRMG